MRRLSTRGGGRERRRRTRRKHKENGLKTNSWSIQGTPTKMAGLRKTAFLQLCPWVLSLASESENVHQIGSDDCRLLKLSRGHGVERV